MTAAFTTAGNAAEPARTIYLARQPIFDTAMDVHAFLEMGLDEIADNRIAFINLTRDVLVGRLPLPFEPGKVVLEILEDISADAEALAGTRTLASRLHAGARRLRHERAEHDRPRELITMTLVRAKMCEGLADKFDCKPDAAFIVGLFSLLDILLDQPLAYLLLNLPLAEDITEGLMHRKGNAGQLLNLVIDYEQGDWGNACTMQHSLTHGISVRMNGRARRLRWKNSPDIPHFFITANLPRSCRSSTSLTTSTPGLMPWSATTALS
ncbi:MAG: hypothetical protein RLZZ227_1646 [Pseudomonadota bacterium]|jgi:c-di-GMP-related signal transduction protein